MTDGFEIKIKPPLEGGDSTTERYSRGGDLRCRSDPDDAFYNLPKLGKVGMVEINRRWKRIKMRRGKGYQSQLSKD